MGERETLHTSHYAGYREHLRIALRHGLGHIEEGIDAEDGFIATLGPTPSTLNPQPSTLNPQPSTLITQHSTLNPQPLTLSPQP